MKVLFIGGTGFISTAVSRLAVERGIELYHLNRGKTGSPVEGVQSLSADWNDDAQARAALGDHRFEAAVNWIAYEPGQVERDIALLSGRVGQYVFISSASAYQKPLTHHVITESTPLSNPYWEYSRNKIACEERLNREYRERGFPMTIVRPSLTYDRQLPIGIGGWGCYTLVDRLKKGKPIIVHGDGSSLWVNTHAEDFGRAFLGLLGNEQAIGHPFHITTDEVLTWNQIYQTIADAVGVEADMVHITSDEIARVEPDLGPTLVGDKTWSVVFDNTKIKAFVPGWQATIPFREGIRRTLAQFDADPARKVVDTAVDAQMDRLVAACRRG